MATAKFLRDRAQHRIVRGNSGQRAASGMAPGGPVERLEILAHRRARKRGKTGLCWVMAATPSKAEAAAFGPRLVGLLGAGWGAAVDVLMPPTCASCKVPVAAAHLHCATCWETLLPPAGTRCSLCSLPLPGQWAAETICLGCLREPPPFRRARAPYRYADAARQTVLRLKNGGWHLAPLMARAMLLEATRPVPGDRLDDLAHGVLIVPVPLHRWRLFRRGYNQAALLAQAMARQMSAECAVDLLVRSRATRSTRGLGRVARAAEMSGAFRVPAQHRRLLSGRHILLVDDVLTTGATASACTRTLLAAGASVVDVLTYARVAADGAGAYAKQLDTGDDDAEG